MRHFKSKHSSAATYPYCTEHWRRTIIAQYIVYHSRLSQLNIGIIMRHQKPQEEATHEYMVVVVLLLPHLLSMQ